MCKVLALYVLSHLLTLAVQAVLFSPIDRGEN